MNTLTADLTHQLLFKKIILFSTVALILVGGPLMVRPLEKLKGKGLNSRAWRASYSERHLPVPPGPREGWWGIHLAPVQDKDLGIVLPERHVPGYFDIDRGGTQSALGSPHPRLHLLIIGGSVAAGAYASDLGRTYFHQLAHRLNAKGCPVQITVLATGAWMSANELQALRFRGLALKPDYVIFLDGLNDVTLKRERPEEQRVREYLDNMRQARDLALANHIKVIFAPQPFLPEKKVKTGYEVLILAESYPRVDHLIKAYDELRGGLRAMTKPGEVYLVDCSGAFDNRKRTVFADIWHFSDIGHAILAKWMTRRLVPLLVSAPNNHDGLAFHSS